MESAREEAHRELRPVEYQRQTASSGFKGLDRRDPHRNVQKRPDGPEDGVGRGQGGLLKGVVPTLLASFFFEVPG